MPTFCIGNIPSIYLHVFIQLIISGIHFKNMVPYFETKLLIQCKTTKLASNKYVVQYLLSWYHFWTRYQIKILHQRIFKNYESFPMTVDSFFYASSYSRDSTFFASSRKIKYSIFHLVYICLKFSNPRDVLLAISSGYEFPAFNLQ